MNNRESGTAAITFAQSSIVRSLIFERALNEPNVIGVRRRRKSGGRCVFRGRVTKKTWVEPQQTFGRERFRTGWIGDGIHQSPVDCRQTGRVRIAERGDNDGSRLVRQSEQAISAAVAVQVDQDIDLAFTDGAIQCGLIQPADFDPLAAEIFQTARDLVVGRSGQGEDRDLRPGWLRGGG